VAIFVIPEADSAANGFTDYAQKGFNDYYDPDKDFSKVLEDDEEYIKRILMAEKPLLAFVSLSLDLSPC